jgi:hypothetical protein
MKSVGNIAKITKAMKMVAASRLRGVQTRMEQSRGLPLPMVKLLGDAPGALRCSQSTRFRSPARSAAPRAHTRLRQPAAQAIPAAAHACAALQASRRSRRC